MNSSKATISKIQTLKASKNYFQAEKLLLKLLAEESFNFDLYQEIQNFYLDLSKEIPFVNVTNIMEFVTKRILEKEDSLKAKQNLGIFYLNSDQIKLALRYFEELNREYPKDLNINLYHALALIKSGKTNQANLKFLSIIEENPLCFDAYYLLALNNKNENIDNFLLNEIIKTLHENKLLDDNGYANLNFTLALILKRKKNYDASFEHFYLACEKKHSQYKNDIEKYLNNIEHIYKVKNDNRQNLIQQSKKFNYENYTEIGFTPIFIVGVPRSGSTLIEAILTSNDMVSSICEGVHLEYVLMKTFGNDYLNKSSKAIYQLDLINYIRTEYANLLKSEVPIDTKFIINKTLNNYKHIDLIKLIFPEAKIIITERNPFASAWSSYCIKFEKGASIFTYNFKDIARYYKNYQDFIQLFCCQTIENLRIQNYETLVVNNEEETKSLIKFLDLKWDDKYLNFHENGKHYDTASSNQVKEKVYNNSLNSWENYQKYLIPLEEAFIKYQIKYK